MTPSSPRRRTTSSASPATRATTKPAEAAGLGHELANASPAGLAYVASGGLWTPQPATVWLPAEHLLLIADRLCDVVRRIRETQAAIAARELPPDVQGPRLRIHMPPRHGKSELTSKYLPAWFVGTNPDLRVILASYGASLANEWGRKARDLLEEHGDTLYGVQVRGDSKAADRWDLDGRQGGMVSAGIGGAITGKGAHLGVIDDPVKDQEEAASEVIRERNKDWYRSTFRTRLMPGAGVVVMQTRWHEDDLSGWLEQEELDGGEEWEVLSLPALATDDGDALERPAGAALWPQMYPAGELDRIARALGAYWWAALYQQDPMPAGGGVFQRSDFRYWHPHPTDDTLCVIRRDGGDRVYAYDHLFRFLTIDPALSEKETADYTAICHWGVTHEMDLLLLDVERQRFDQPKQEEFIDNLFRAWAPARIEVESAAHGTGLIQHLVRKGLPIGSLEADRDKVTRARGAVPRYEAHTVYHRQGAPWVGAYEKELLMFPTAKNDDQVDCFSYAALKLPDLQLAPTKQKGTGRTVAGGLRDAEM